MQYTAVQTLLSDRRLVSFDNGTSLIVSDISHASSAS